MSIDSLLKMKAPQARLAYVEAQSAVEFMAKQFGDQRLIELLKNIRHQKISTKLFDLPLVLICWILKFNGMNSLNKSIAGWYC